MQKALFQTITTLNQGTKGKMLQIHVPFSKDTLNLLACLKRNHLLLGYSLDKLQKTFHVFLLPGKPIFHLFIYSSKRRNFRISAVELKKFENRHFLQTGPVYILLTAIGFLSHHEAVAKGLGGLLFGKFMLK